MNKTVPTGANVDEFLATIADDFRRSDCIELRTLMEETTGEPAQMWGDSIVGFGDFLLTYESGRQVRWTGAGFSPRKRAITIYLSMALNLSGDLLADLGPHKTGVGCLYINHLSDINLDALRRLITVSMETTREMAGLNE